MNNLLTQLSFDEILCERAPQTQTGSDLVDRYRSFLMTNPVSCKVVNSFINEASQCLYDGAISNMLSTISEFISENKTSWALASVVENINDSPNANYLDRNAARQVTKLLEMAEDDVVKYIKAGALKNVMFCESIRNIARQVYKDQPMIIHEAEYTCQFPLSYVESTEDGMLFEVRGRIFKMDADKNVTEASVTETSNTFRTISNILESNICEYDENAITVSCGNSKYVISEAGKCQKVTGEKTEDLTTDTLRENNRLVVMAQPLQLRNQTAAILESIAIICENYSNIVFMDNVSIYTTNNDQFMVIENGANIYASLIKSNHNPAWTINEGAINACSFIKRKTNVTLGEKYSTAINQDMSESSEVSAEQVKEELKNSQILNIQERIERLTEKFKDDPVKLKILAGLASNLADC